MRQCYSMMTKKWLALLAVAVFLQTGQAAEKERNGEAVYQKTCKYCHEAGVGPELRSRLLPAVYTTQVVRHGNRAMPAFRPTEISEQELERVAAFIERDKEGAQ